jgi:hypothetical protein
LYVQVSASLRSLHACREGDKLSEAIDEAASHKKGKVTDTKLTPEQLEEVRSH